MAVGRRGGHPQAVMVERNVIIFRLYPEEGRTLYVRVHVHETLKALRERSRELQAMGMSSDYVGRRCQGFVTEWQRWWIDENGRSRRDPCIAEVNVARRYCTMRIITHELQHATLAWARRVDFAFTMLYGNIRDMDQEERICYMHGDLCNDFVVRAQEAGVLP